MNSATLNAKGAGFSKIKENPQKIHLTAAMTAQLLENRYRVLQELGQGGFGETFLAEDLHMPSSRRCVIKQLKPVTNEPRVYQIVKERFQREAVILEKLGEDNRQIPSLYAYFTEAGQFYLVQEWIEGQTLSQNIEQQGLWTSAAIAQLLLGLLPVLDFIHDQGIVHRDLKPDNIILRKSDRSPVLIDFGAVKETMGTQMNTAGNTTSSIVIGTPGFMPSEQAIGRPVFSSDLYSLGLTAIFLLTGKYPQDFPSDPATGKIIWRSPQLNINNHLANVLDQAICTHPRDRFTSASAMLQALQADSATIPMAIPPVVPIPETAIPPAVSASVSNAPVTSQETVVSQPAQPQPNTIAPTVASPQATVVPQSSIPATPVKQGMADWQKAVLTGGVVGIFLLSGIIGYDQLRSDRDNEPTLINGSNQGTAGNELPTDTTPSDNTDPLDPPATEVVAIDAFGAKGIVAEWLACKQELLSHPYDRYCGRELLTGKAFNDNIRRDDGKQSSVEWLEDTGSYYLFEDQQIEEINEFEVQGDRATIELIVTESRTLYNAKGRKDKKNSGYDQRLVRYDLEFTPEGTWKIADYDTLEILWK